MKMTKSESGKLGAAKSAETWSLKIQKKVDEYNSNPCICEQCDNPIPYDKRRNKFCGSSCSAAFNNTARGKKNKTETCLGCLKSFTPGKNTQKKYCSNKCQKHFQTQERIRVWLAGGEKAAKAATKAYLFNEQDGKCAHCGTSNVWNGKPLVFDLEHKDGNSENNVRENLELICPNCHSQTDTYKGKNMGNGRYARRQRYQDGKSF